MTELFLLLLRILFPLDFVARARELTRDYLAEIIGWLEDPLALADIRHDPCRLARLEAHIIVAEHGVQLLIHDRARQLLGLPFVYIPRLKRPELTRAHTLGHLFKRLHYLIRLFDHADRLAQRRADRMRRELEQTPLRPDAPHRSTSPACGGGV
jgi:hypothetical protein